MSESGSDRKSLRQSVTSKNKKLSIQVEEDEEDDLKGGLIKNQATNGPTEFEVAQVDRML